MMEMTTWEVLALVAWVEYLESKERQGNCPLCLRDMLADAQRRAEDELANARAKEAACERLEELLVTAEQRAAALEGALQEITEGKGRYALDPLEHAANCIEDMRALARAALTRAAPRPEGQ